MATFVSLNEKYGGGCPPVLHAAINRYASRAAQSSNIRAHANAPRNNSPPTVVVVDKSSAVSIRDKMYDVERKKQDYKMKLSASFHSKKYAVANYYREEMQKCDERMKRLSRDYVIERLK